MSSFINHDNYEDYPLIRYVKDLRSKYNLVIYWYRFNEEEGEKIFESSGLTSDTIVEILKLYTISPSLRIVITERLEVKE